MASISFPSFSVLFSTFLFLFLHASIVAEGQVPVNETFKVVNEGEFGDYITEYDASYRLIEVDSLFAFPFRLCFYNTTPGEFVLGMRAGLPRDEDLMRWVWDANRNRPVKENATLSFGRDGNLVLAEADGTVAWQTNTANKGVTGIRMMRNGNLVLFDKNGKFVWQSFDHPVDTLLSGMSVRTKLISRTSDSDGRDGKYSLVVDPKGLNFYLNNAGKLVRYNGWGTEQDKTLVSMLFKTEPIDQDPKSAGWELLIEPFYKSTSPPAPQAPRRGLLQSFPIGSGNALILRKLNYNASITYLRLNSDGNVKAYTYFNDVPYLKWSETFAYFSDYYVRECGLPEKCGSLGLCQRGMCIACPTPKGLLGWSETCSPPALKPCSAKGNKVDYFKIDAAEHFLNQDSTGNGEGPTSLEACRDKCTKDCGCKAFVYKQDIKKCLRVPVLGTFIKDTNTSTAYIKYSL
ncbi:OLC1v1023239C1 [Oldenlandia corymbosa var. corymbosa]|uniref:OLC1v1023239C1 n=1 Tax=Oldenlandia corymbosa var. corymbosa TaxID=529605 RepID=A0AAV1C373_OLDCO|nr:OLC1v1023239C1 [Oldenlandia corymbosa var. corymbosa]